MLNNIFISYNSNSTDERILVEGLYKKGKQNGYNLFLPERTISNKLNLATKEKINSSDWFIVFSFEQLSNIVREEIDYALTQKKINQKNVIVIFSHKNGKNIDFGDFKPTIKFIENNLRLDEIDIFIDSLLKDIVTNDNSRRNVQNDDFSTLKTILGIGAAALILNAIFSDND